MVKVRLAVMFLSLLCVSGTVMGDPVVMLSLYPEFPQAVMSSVASCGEFVFLLDRSGSMDCPMDRSKRRETRIGSARVFIMRYLLLSHSWCPSHTVAFTIFSLFP